MKVRYNKFWSSFDPTYNFFQRYLEYKGYNPEVITKTSEMVDLEITSVFEKPLGSLENKVHNKLISEKYYGNKRLEKLSSSRQLRQNPATRRLWYTGENIRPPFSMNYDGYLSYDQYDFDGINSYFPLWYTHLDWFGKPEFNFRVGKEVVTSELLTSRKLTTTKTKLAIVFLSNPHPYRLKVIEILRRYGQVDVYGGYTSNPVKYKMDVSSEYKFMLCFENDNYPGYVTEKLLDAYLSETIPLYWGNLGKNSIYNEAAFLNLNDYENIDHWIGDALSLNYEEIYQEALFKEEPSLLPLDYFIMNITTR